MGEVYRATDTSLGRQVAIKILPDTFAVDPDRLARFEREARTLATLNHPHIASIYAIEKSGAVRALVMELVEGEDLAQRIARGAMPMDDALKIARQIADALQAAHEQGIVHRDLKPANIRIRQDGTVKVLDFGLAKAVEGAGTAGMAGGMGTAGGDLFNSPTLTSPANVTGIGVILGTAAYMAPEQAKGRNVDARADIWALGAVLFEVLSGKRAFDGEDMTDVLGAVVRLDPQWDALPSAVPARIRRVIQLCLKKDPKERLASIQDVRLALDGAFETAATAAAAPSRAVWPLALGAALTAAIVAAAGAWVMKPAPASTPRQVTRFAVPLPAGQQFVGLANVTLSPDGRAVAYVANGQAYVRRLEESEPVAVRGANLPANGQLMATWSPDGEWLAFGLVGQIVRVPVGGGVLQPVARPTGPVWGLTWNDNDTLLYGSVDGIWQVGAAGGTPERLIEAQGKPLTSPQWLPDGKTLLFCVGEDPADASVIVAQSPGSSEQHIVWKGGFSPRYVSSGHLVFAQADRLLAVPFDAASHLVRGVPIEILSGVAAGRIAWHDTPEVAFSISRTGAFAFSPSSASPRRSRTAVWVDRTGRETPVGLPADEYLDPRVDPKGERLAMAIRPNGSTLSDVWVVDLKSGGKRRITSLQEEPGIPSGLGTVPPLWHTPRERLEQSCAIQRMAAGRRKCCWLTRPE